MRDNKITAGPEATAPKKKRLKIAVLSVAALLVVCLAVSVIYIQGKFSLLNEKINTGDFTMEPDTEDPDASSLPEAGQTDLDDIKNDNAGPDSIWSSPDVTNVLLLGLDTRNPKQFSGGRTDSMIIVSFDRINKQVKLTSIMRDTLIRIPGHDLNRINTVFGFSGPEAAMKTVQQYFGIKIDHYAVVNFWAVANIIDSVGGVKIDVKKAEIEDLNHNLIELNKYSKDADSPDVKQSGSQTLNGKQAAAYMRIRHVGEADFERTERQRRVLEAIANKDMSLGDILAIADSLPQNVRTDVNQLGMINLAKIAYGLKGSPVKQLRLPIKGSYKFSRYKKMSILIVDFKKNAEALKEFITNK